MLFSQLRNHLFSQFDVLCFVLFCFVLTLMFFLMSCQSRSGRALLPIFKSFMLPIFYHKEGEVPEQEADCVWAEANRGTPQPSPGGLRVSSEEERTLPRKARPQVSSHFFAPSLFNAGSRPQRAQAKKTKAWAEGASDGFKCQVQGISFGNEALFLPVILPLSRDRWPAKEMFLSSSSRHHGKQKQDVEWMLTVLFTPSQPDHVLPFF